VNALNCEVAEMVPPADPCNCDVQLPVNPVTVGPWPAMFTALPVAVELLTLYWPWAGSPWNRVALPPGSGCVPALKLSAAYGAACTAPAETTSPRLTPTPNTRSDVPILNSISHATVDDPHGTKPLYAVPDHTY
jgi:hypothetical protein